jgi:hypothetical protein
MAVIQLENGNIADDFEMGEYPLILKDALVMPLVEYEKLTPEEIISMKQSRYDKWYAYITTPVDEVLLTEEVIV